MISITACYFQEVQESLIFENRYTHYTMEVRIIDQQLTLCQKSLERIKIKLAANNTNELVYLKNCKVTKFGL